MKVVVQRCSRAEVTVEGQVVGRIAGGLLLLVGVEGGDTSSDAERIARKIAQLRVFADAEGRTNLSLRDVGGEVLCISQFTLCADCSRGNRPSFSAAARPEVAQPLYDYLCRTLHEDWGLHVATGRFGAHMEVSLLNDGPLTLVLDSALL